MVLHEGSRSFQDLMISAACLIFVSKDPLFDALRDFRLGLLVNGQTRRGKDAAIEIAAGLWTILIDGALAASQHGAVSTVGITHQHVPLGPAGGGKEQRAGNLPDGLLFVRLDMDEHGGAATASTGAAGDIDAAASGLQRSFGCTKPSGKIAGRRNCGGDGSVTLML